ncbi:hypothetical protein [Chitinimonas koreensis]|uniref:hypothetical protein n=1 Tax=Chitinimonas koreensis TaxID=356302 RepID=UPI0003FA2E93|nr:hypothetical protein [Chitinimonas koreensis]QNM98724.1 hypothetical protein H9L41_11185 [Chitinimonas koreensis]
MKSAIDRTGQLADLAGIALRQAAQAVPAAAAAASALRLAAPAGDFDPPPLPQSCIDWLSELVLLYGVPFDYLVPVAAMLPAESIRFFYLDQNYSNRLIDGAASIGVGSSVESLALLSQIENVINQALQRLAVPRSARTGQPAGTPSGAPSGFLLRSAAVSGWPGIEVTATDAQGGRVSLLRLDRLSTDVLFCLFGGTPAEVRIHQPSESLHFGVIDDNQGHYSATLRYVAGAQAGQQIGTQTAPVSLRTGTVADVVDVSKTVAALTQALQQAGALPPQGVTAAEFAIEMVQSAGVQPFNPAAKEA